MALLPELVGWDSFKETIEDVHYQSPINQLRILAASSCRMPPSSLRARSPKAMARTLMLVVPE
jgi:hypothetical protein